MRRYLLVLTFVSMSLLVNAQNYVIPSTFQPLSMDEMMLSAQAEAIIQQRLRQSFEEYQDKAYDCLNDGNYQGFITYSSYALNTGWYSSKLYYDRGAVFEQFHDYNSAKKEYRHAIRKGFLPAKSALAQCKARQKEWKKRIH